MSTPNAKSINKKAGSEKKPRFGTVPRTVPHKAIIGILFIIIAYGVLLFLLRDRLLITPDIDRSDAFHFNISLKHYLWETLHNNRLPFWTDKLQGGYPLFAEGQIGALFLPNLLILRLFNFAAGYNFLFVLSLFLLTSGMYLLLLQFSVSPILSLLLSFLFTFNGSISFRWIHMNVIQVFSIVPFLFYFYQKWIGTLNRRYGIVLIFLVSQTVYAGHLQIAFITLLGLSCWHGVHMITGKYDPPTFKRVMAQYFFWILSGIMLALPQLVPTYVLSQFSSRSISAGYEFATSYSLPPLHLLSFILPYPFGNAKNGTYSDSLSQWGLFWENSPYTGILFIALFAVLYIFCVIKRKAGRQVHVVLGLSVFFIILALGKNSPLYFLFDMFPFNVFRTPPKYLLMAVFFLILSFAFLAKDLVKNTAPAVLKMVIYAVLIISLIDLVTLAFSYHVFGLSTKALSKPEIARFIGKDDRYLTFGFSKTWFDLVTTKGWKDKNDLQKFDYFNNFLIPNSNLIYGYNTYDVNTGGLRLRRPDYINASIGTAILATDSPVYNIATKSALPFMQLANVSTVITSVQIQLEGLTKVKEIKKYGIPIYVYKTPVKTDEDYYVPERVTHIQYLDELLGLHKQGSISTASSIIEDYRSFTQKAITPALTVSKTENQSTYTGVYPEETFIVFKINWYPEIEVRIDGKQATVLKTNLVHTGVWVPKGKHAVSVSYVPKFFYYGTAASVIYLFVLAAVVLKFLKK